MARFLGIGIYTNVKCASGVQVAFLRPDELTRANASESPTDPESFVFGFSREHAALTHVVEGRVARVCFSDTALDREWDIASLEDGALDLEIVVTCQGIATRLARIVFQSFDAATGEPYLDFAGAALTITEWHAEIVDPTLDAAGLTWLALGTVNPTTRFAMTGEWVTLIEILNTMCADGNGTCEWHLRRNGDTDYKLDFLTTIGGTAATRYVRTKVNLLESRRVRSLIDVATRVYVRGVGVTRTMSDHFWRVKTVVSGTVLELEDPLGGAGPIKYDNQLNGLYLGHHGTGGTPFTFASQVVSASVASTQRVTVPSTAGFSAGTSYVRFYRTSTINGQRVTSLTHPTRVLAPSAGGYGDRAFILDRPDITGDCNLVQNALMRTWTTPTSAPDGWARTHDGGGSITWSQETADTVYPDTTVQKLVVNTGWTPADPAVGLAFLAPTARVLTSATDLYSASVWMKVVAAPAASESSISILLGTLSPASAFTVGSFVRGGGENIGKWIRYQISGVLLGNVVTQSQLFALFGSPIAAGWTVLFGPVTVSRTPSPIADRENSGGNLLWQAANLALDRVSSPITGYDVAVADLERNDGTTFADFKLEVGGNVVVQDTDLGIATTLRLVEYAPDYLAPLQTRVRLGAFPERITALTTPLEGMTPPDAGTTDATTLVLDDKRVEARRVSVVASYSTYDPSSIQVLVEAKGWEIGKTPAVKLASLSAGATLTAGKALGLYTTSGAFWTFTLPKQGRGPACAVFEATYEGVSSTCALILPESSTGLYDAGNSGTSITINWNNGPAQKLTLTNNCTVSFSNPVAGMAYTLMLVQDGTGGRTVTLTGWDFGDNAPTYNTGIGKKNLVSALYDGGEYLAAHAVKGA